jgi:hypothetical protein
VPIAANFVNTSENDNARPNRRSHRSTLTYNTRTRYCVVKRCGKRFFFSVLQTILTQTRDTTRLHYNLITYIIIRIVDHITSGVDDSQNVQTTLKYASMI